MKCEYECGQEANFRMKNGKWCCSKNQNSCPAIRKKISESKKKNYIFTVNANNIKVDCRFCEKKIAKSGIKRHEEFCYLNPVNLKLCPVCNEPIKEYRKNTTCSYACSNTFFRSGPENGQWKEKNGNNKSIRSTCFHYHEKKCVVCGEDLIVAVHHFDENRKNNNPENLMPLCPTHHQYWHSKHKHLIEKKVVEYRENFQLGRSPSGDGTGLLIQRAEGPA